MSIKVFFLLISLGYPPCEYEDSVNCYWDAATMGNGGGTSFIDIDGDLIPVL